VQKLVPTTWVVLILTVGSGSRADDQRLPAMHRIAILFKMLTYDKNLKVRCRGGVRIGIVGLQGNDESLSVAKETLKAVSAGKTKKIEGLPIHAQLVEFRKPSDVWKAIDRSNLNILYLGPGLESHMKDIARFSAMKKILIVTGESKYMSSGAALGITLHEGKPRILMHYKTASAQGAKFDLRITRIVERVD